MAIKRAARWTVVGLAVLAVLLVALVLGLTRTDAGVERAGQFALEQVRGAINGELSVGRISSGSLLEGLTLHEVAITGPDGRPFVAADSARLAYRIRTILAGSLVFDRLFLYDPEVVIERLPGEEQWNYQKIFADTTAPDTTTGGNLVLIQDATVVDGLATVRMPWEQEGPVAPEDTARLILEEVPGGLVRVWRFEDIDARVPQIVWETPEEEGKLIRIAGLSTQAFVWETPAEIEALEGVVTIQDSLISFDAPRAQLPSSRLALLGQIVLGQDGAENRYDIEVRSDDIALADLQWIYPDLPSDGGGSLTFRMQTQAPGSMLWLARDARIRTEGTSLAGSFGVVTGDTVYFTNVDLEASPLDLDLIQRLVPQELPIEGLLIGTVEVEGPISALRSRGDLRVRTFRDGEAGESSVRWAGTVDFRRPYRIRGIEARLEEVDLEQAAQFAPGLRLRGAASGRVQVSGSPDRGLDLAGELVLKRDSARTTVRGSGRFERGGDRPTLDLRFDAEPLDLARKIDKARGIRGPKLILALAPILAATTDPATFPVGAALAFYAAFLGLSLAPRLLGVLDVALTPGGMAAYGGGGGSSFSG